MSDNAKKTALRALVVSRPLYSALPQFNCPVPPKHQPSREIITGAGGLSNHPTTSYAALKLLSKWRSYHE